MWSFRAKGNAQSVPAETAEIDPPGGQLAGDDMAMETLNALLKTYGRHAFDVEDTDAKSTRETCDKWAKHLQYGGASPSSREDTYLNGARDWHGVKNYFQKHRQREEKAVSGAMKDLRQSVWTFVGELNRSVSDDREANELLGTQVTRMRSATTKPTLDEVRKEVSEIAQSITQVIDQKQKSQQQTIALLQQQIQQLGSALQEAKSEAMIDPLTQIGNRKAFDAALGQAVMVSNMFKKPACVIMVDADHFKKVNDTYGHATGDVVLQTLANCLSRCFPRRNDCVARYGGEEFAVILPETDFSEGCLLAQKVIETVRSLTVEDGGKTLQFTISAGIAAVRPGDTGDELVKRADQALYRAKQGGRNRWCQ